MKIIILDRLTLGEDLDISYLYKIGEVVSYDTTTPDCVEERIKDADVIFVNKLKLNEENLKDAKNLKLICEAATGYDNIDIDYCKKRGIAVCNVPGYSVYSVSQITVAMALYLCNHISEYTRYVKDGTYINSSSANILTPVYNELYSKTWGIIGYGAIGKRVGEIAKALGCNIICYKRKKEEGVKCVDLDTLLSESDIISVHIPLTEETKNLISKEKIKLLKKNAIFINTARGADVDEEAICLALKEGKIAGLGCDVYSIEPLPKNSPYVEIKDYYNVCLTPHMAWGAKEARERCFDIMIKNMNAFFNGEILNRVDIVLH